MNTEQLSDSISRSNVAYIEILSTIQEGLKKEIDILAQEFKEAQERSIIADIQLNHVHARLKGINALIEETKNQKELLT